MKVIVSLIEVFCMKHSPGFQALKIIFFFFFCCFGWILFEICIKLSGRKLLISVEKVYARYYRAPA